MTHEHGHEHGPLETIDHVHGGAPAVDIGGDIGAVVALMDPDTAGTELFLRPDDEPGRRIHTGVWTRHQGAGHVTAAVFCELVEGAYWVLDAGGGDLRSVRVTGGEIVEIDLRS